MPELRKFQAEALDALIGPRHVLTIAPTGSGKSLIYEETARRPGFRTLLITPLVALARQQRERLQALGLQVAYWGGGIGAGRLREADFESQVWICSPESLRSSSRLGDLHRWRPSFLVVDECHCLWEWGTGFRPAFLDVPPLIEELEIPRSIWLTATLPREAREDLLRRLPSGVIEIGEFDLPESLSLRVLRAPWDARAEILAEWLCGERGGREGAGIIFVSTREATYRVSRLVRALGRRSIVYHAGIGAEERLSLERRIAEELPEIVVATSPFGLGMNHPHLRWMAHWQAPPSLLSLAQAVGRVGRDANSSGEALVLWDPEDFRLIEWIARGAPQRERELAETLRFLSTRDCRRRLLRAYFNGRTAPKLSEACRRCDFCLLTAT